MLVLHIEFLSWLFTDVISHIQHFKTAVFQQRLQSFVRKTIVIVGSRMVLITPGNQMQCKTALLRYPSNRIERFPRTYSVFKDSKAKCNIKAAIGGGVGGAVGAVIGEELGDREGAIIGAGVGAAVGAAIATDGEDDVQHSEAEDHQIIVAVQEELPPAHGRHCPPGQAKKGRC